jgi:hypothetical protein
VEKVGHTATLGLLRFECDKDGVHDNGRGYTGCEVIGWGIQQAMYRQGQNASGEIIGKGHVW